MNLPLVVEVLVAALLVASGVLVLASAIGFVRLKDFFLRMHPPALAYTLGNWCVALACVLYFSMRDGHPVLHPLLVPVLLAVTVPVTTMLLARVTLFRQRQRAVPDVPPALPGASCQDAEPEPGGASR